LTGARLFSGSFESAIYLLHSIAGVPDHINVIPAINSNFSYHISAGLADGTVITGQNSISHPSIPTALRSASNTDLVLSSGHETEEQDRIEDANLPGSLPTLRKQYIEFSKEGEEDLPSRIERIWYINPYGQEIRPAANPAVTKAILESQGIIYSIGSLYTSIIPSLILRGVGEAIASPLVRCKILILNGSLDRETGPTLSPFTAADFVEAIARAGAESRGFKGRPPRNTWKNYVTHLIHLEGEGTPKVGKEELKELGIETVKIYGRRVPRKPGMVYDGQALVGALEAILGRRGPRHDKSRRNTLEA
jgi:2-phospho-L-lactate transferase/gluconeogenesis factor (CofD/UPF0052 family)